MQTLSYSSPKVNANTRKLEGEGHFYDGAPSRPGSWAPAWTLTQLCCPHCQHHYKTSQQRARFSAPVPLAKTFAFCERAQRCLWWTYTCAPGHSSSRTLYPPEPCDGPKAPGQQGSTTPADECKHSRGWAAAPKCSPGPGQFQIGRKMLHVAFFLELCPSRCQTPKAGPWAPTLPSPHLMLEYLRTLSSSERPSHGIGIEWIPQVASAATPGQIWSNTTRIHTF